MIIRDGDSSSQLCGKKKKKRIQVGQSKYIITEPVAQKSFKITLLCIKLYKKYEYQLTVCPSDRLNIYIYSVVIRHRSRGAQRMNHDDGLVILSDFSPPRAGQNPLFSSIIQT